MASLFHRENGEKGEFSFFFFFLYNLLDVFRHWESADLFDGDSGKENVVILPKKKETIATVKTQESEQGSSRSNKTLDPKPPLG